VPIEVTGALSPQLTPDQKSAQISTYSAKSIPGLSHEIGMQGDKLVLGDYELKMAAMSSSHLRRTNLHD